MIKMKVILQQDVKKLGKKGDIVEVSEGYGRNFLLPRKAAVPATSQNLNVANAQAGSKARKEADRKSTRLNSSHGDESRMPSSA